MEAFIFTCLPLSLEKPKALWLETHQLRLGSCLRWAKHDSTGFSELIATSPSSFSPVLSFAFLQSFFLLVGWLGVFVCLFFPERKIKGKLLYHFWWKEQQIDVGYFASQRCYFYSSWNLIWSSLYKACFILNHAILLYGLKRTIYKKHRF